MTGEEVVERPRVGIFHGANAAASLHEITRAAKGICDPVFLFRDATAREHPALVAATARIAEHVVVADDADPGKLAALRLAGVTTFHDLELEACDAAQRALGLPGGMLLSTPWDKLTQRDAFRAARCSALAAVPVDSADDLTAALASVGVPGVLKPRRGVASAGVSFIRTPGDAAREAALRTGWANLVYESMIDSGRHPAGVPWLADYISVETISTDRHHHLAIFDKFPLAIADEPTDDFHRHHVRETGDVLPTQLPDDVAAAALDLTSAALDSLGIRWRVSHTELKITPTGLDIVEVNGRLGGEVARMLHLLDGPAVLRAALTVTLGREPDLNCANGPGYVATVYAPFPARSGLVASSATLADVRRLSGVVAVDEVAVAGTPRRDTGYRTSKFVIRAQDRAELLAHLKASADGLTELFTADGLHDDPWLTRLRGGLRADTSGRTDAT